PLSRSVAGAFLHLPQNEMTPIRPFQKQDGGLQAPRRSGGSQPTGRSGQIDNRNFDWNGPQVAVLVSQKVLLHRAGFEPIIGVARPDSLRIHAVRTERSTVLGQLDV